MDAETVIESLCEVLGKGEYGLDMLEHLKDELMSTAELNNSQKKRILAIVEKYNGNIKDVDEIVNLLRNAPSFVTFIDNSDATNS